jgi:hypothetical protein
VAQKPRSPALIDPIQELVLLVNSRYAMGVVDTVEQERPHNPALSHAETSYR